MEFPVGEIVPGRIWPVIFNFPGVRADLGVAGGFDLRRALKVNPFEQLIETETA